MRPLNLKHRETRRVDDIAAFALPARLVIVITALVAMLGVSFVAPYRWSGVSVLAKYGNGTGQAERSRSIQYAPLWRQPQHGPYDGPFEDQQITLDTGLFALWWGAIVVVAGAALVLAHTDSKH